MMLAMMQEGDEGYAVEIEWSAQPQAQEIADIIRLTTGSFHTAIRDALYGDEMFPNEKFNKALAHLGRADANKVDDVVFDIWLAVAEEQFTILLRRWARSHGLPPLTLRRALFHESDFVATLWFEDKTQAAAFKMLWQGR